MIFMFLFPIAYCIGSIPSGYWFAKYFFGVDVTKNGSGNIGATNVARVLGSKKCFFYIFLFDFFKTFSTIFLCEKIFLLSGGLLLLIGVFLLVGNGYSIFLGFRGGKGVATTIGVLAALFPVLCFVFIFVWLAILLFVKRVWVASLGGAFSILPVYFFYTPVIDLWAVLFLLFIVGWVFVRHKDNIRKFYSGRAL